jgi:hypothetical protein
MGFRLSRQQDADWQRAIGKARSALDTLSEAVGAYNNETERVAGHGHAHVRRLAPRLRCAQREAARIDMVCMSKDSAVVP